MALSASLVEQVFARMLVRYGSAWRAKWQGVEPEAVKADWAEQLGGFGLAALTHGLANLPDDFPPSVTQFKALCLSRPNVVALPPLKRGPLPPEVAAKIAPLVQAWKSRKPLQWAYDLQERERRGDSLSVTQRAAWRVTLQRRSDETIVGAFVPIPERLHPPGGLRPEP